VITKRVGRAGVAVVALMLVVGAFAATASANRFTPGSPGLGDPFFPNAGNGGYDAQHYTLDLDYDPATHRLVGTATIVAESTQGLKTFNLDLREFLSVTSIETGTKKGFKMQPAEWWRDGQELTVSPREKIRDRTGFSVVVTYEGIVEPIVDPDDSIEGFVPTNDGAFVVNEPQGSPGWYPANDNPNDKALFDISVTVPEGLTALANGVLVSSTTANGKTTWSWSHSNPMATYLATATLGVFDLTTSTLADGTPNYVAVDPAITSSRAVLSRIPAVYEFLESVFGDYPFDSIGAIVDRAPNVGYALESQTKPNYASMPSEATLVHEIAHQWYGDSVSLEIWPDMWLNEGFATFSEWLWTEHLGTRTAQQAFNTQYARAATSSFWLTPPAALPGPDVLFSTPVYQRGAMTLQALRVKIGDLAFFQLIRDWADDNRYGNVSTADFIAAAEAASGMDLDAFFDVWLFSPAKPTSW
jgi:aminopeptidase N